MDLFLSQFLYEDGFAAWIIVEYCRENAALPFNLLNVCSGSRYYTLLHTERTGNTATINRAAEIM